MADKALVVTTESDLKLALLIDAENISSKYIDLILREVTSIGNIIYKRVYGDWTLSNLSSWKNIILKNALHPIQQYQAVSKKNSSDFALVIDAMDLLYRADLDGFCLVSSDSDFARLAARLREGGKFVLGIGEKKTPISFVNACNRFISIDLLFNQTAKKSKATGGNTQSGQGKKGSARAKIKNYLDTQREKQAAHFNFTEAEEEPKKRVKDKEQATRSGQLADEKAIKPHQSSKDTDQGQQLVSETAQKGSFAQTGEAQDRNTEEFPLPEPVNYDLNVGDKSSAFADAQGYEEEELFERWSGYDLESVKEALREIAWDRSDEQGWIFTGSIGNMLLKRMPEFDVRNFGYKKLSEFLDSLDMFEKKQIISSEDESVKAIYYKLRD